MNHPYQIEFLDKRLWMPVDKMHKENIVIILSQLKMTVLVCLCAIIHITICLPTLWLAGDYHIIAVYRLYVRSMGILVDELDTALGAIE